MKRGYVSWSPEAIRKGVLDKGIVYHVFKRQPSGKLWNFSLPKTCRRATHLCRRRCRKYRARDIPANCIHAERLRFETGKMLG